MRVVAEMRRQIRRAFIARARRRISRTINDYTKSYYPDFNFGQAVDGEEEHLRKWGGFLGFELDPLYYRLYSVLSGVPSVDYIPDDVYVIFILKLLNRHDKDHVYRDKNLYDMMFPNGLFPRVYLRKVHGAYLESTYAPVGNVDKYLASLGGSTSELIVKPAVDTSSGKNVIRFRHDGGVFRSDIGQVLDKAFLDRNYGDNFLIQELVRQDESVSRFNPESVNTVRIYTYRSFLTNNVHTLSYSLRVGVSGKLTDNLNSGGWGVGVSRKGELFSRGINKYGQTVTDLNGISLNDKHVIPDFEDFVEVAEFVASRFLYDRFLGLDVFRDATGKMRLMEVNLGHIGTDLPHLIGTPLFGEFTDEIISWCRDKKQEIGNEYLLRI